MAFDKDSHTPKKTNANGGIALAAINGEWAKPVVEMATVSLSSSGDGSSYRCSDSRFCSCTASTCDCFSGNSTSSCSKSRSAGHGGYGASAPQKPAPRTAVADEGTPLLQRSSISSRGVYRKCMMSAPTLILCTLWTAEIVVGSTMLSIGAPEIGPRTRAWRDGALMATGITVAILAFLSVGYLAFCACVCRRGCDGCEPNESSA